MFQSLAYDKILFWPTQDFSLQPLMLRNNHSENKQFSLPQTLTKFNLTNYKQKNQEISLKNYDYLHHKQFSPRKPSSNKIKIGKTQTMLRLWHQLPTFGTLDVQNIVRKRKIKKTSVMNIQVTSRSQKHLIEFINPQNLPKISIKNMLKKSPVKKIVEAANNEDKFRKFTQSYFRSLEKAKATLLGKSIDKQFGQVKSMGWSVRGYLINGNIVLKATRWTKKRNMFQKERIEKYKKYVFNSEIRKQVSQDYEQFVKQWLYLDQILSS